MEYPSLPDKGPVVFGGDPMTSPNYLNIQAFQSQHKEIIQLAETLQTLLDENSLKQNADAAMESLAKLGDRLIRHLAEEDRVLYPAYANSPDKETQDIGHRFISEMGGLRSTFAKYITIWPSSIEIQNNPEGFIDQTKRVLSALNNRINNEERFLYPAADKLFSSYHETHFEDPP